MHSISFSQHPNFKIKLSSAAMATTTNQSDSNSNSSNLSKLQAISSKLSTQFPSVQNITPAAVTALQISGSQRIVLVDARSAEEYAVSSIPSSLTVEEFEAREAEFKDAKVIAFCTIGYRSSQYVEALQKRGTVVDAANLEGSILAWTHAGLPLVERRGGGEEVATDRVHVFDERWALQAEGYTPVTFT